MSLMKNAYFIKPPVHMRRLFSQLSSFTAKSPQNLQLNYLEERDNGIVVLELNRPETKNALNRTLAANFFQAIDSVKYDKNVRVLIVRSMVPGIFCAGADLKERLKLTNLEVKIFVSQLRSLTNAVENLPVPVIAAVDGAALGGGFELALACDIRTASDNAKFGLVETKLAIIPGAGGTQRLPRLIGPAFAKELIFTAKTLTGREALEMGIVNYTVKQNNEGNAAYLKALEIAREIIPNGPLSVRLAKVAINTGLEADISTGNIIEEACYAQVVPTKDRVEGLVAFQEKRTPVYTGD
jgi:methylglutaconyl-CoA hydratase